MALAVQEDIAAVELRALSGNLDLPGYFEDTYGSPDRLPKNLCASNVKIFALDTSFALAESRVDRDQLLAHVRWAEALAIPWLRVFDGGHASGSEDLAEFAATIRWWRRLRQSEGWQVDLLVETHDSLVTARAIADFSAVCPATSLLWDSHNTWRRGGEDPVETWQKIRNLSVAHIHVKDSIRRPSARHPFTFVLPGTGEFPMASLRAALGDGYDGLVSLEWERQWHPYLPPLAEALAHADMIGWW